MSVEDALFIFSMFGFSLLTFGFMGGYLRFFGELMAIWLMTAGLIVLSVGIIVLFVRNDAFANSTSKCKITKCFCKSTPLVLRNSISFLVSH